ncbi:MAG: helix-turn-helix domain-containing protein [Parvibaculum sp.]|uniref:HVO_A0114 family putative DNA-binding protein n=1 Tax=Parvibaculum sp. TaxID=2024848 RepID=UPI00271BC2DF|nr:helix-turn-helix domain-containing protein [Parvibaculum sp.]MDO8839438.1 helix-turn-helix domain-containing protein [Parvibaculum sp.]
MGRDALTKRNAERRKAEKVLRIGIASRAEMRARTLAIARGTLKPAPSDPKVWFSSLESLAQVLSSKNQLLLETIRKARPGSLKELAELSGRAEGNLSRTLRTMARYGLVRLDKADGRRIVPEVPWDRVALDMALERNAA